jgi:hypothetical protein
LNVCIAEDKEEAQFVPHALMGTMKGKKPRRGITEKLEKENSSVSPQVNISHAANHAKPTEKTVDKSVKRSLSLIANSKRRNGLLQYLPLCPDVAKRQRIS